MKLLKVESLSHWFGGLKAVGGFNLELEQGELVAIIGPNGAGKTTVFNLITGVYRPAEGKVMLDGRDLVGLPVHEVVSSGIARTFQNIRLFKDLTVLDNVRIAHYSSVRYSPLDAILRLPRFRHEEERIREHSMELIREFGLEGVAGAVARNLPYGLQRRLEIARALSTGPSVLLLDEPAAGMNPAEVEQLMGLISSIRSRFNLSILLIEHQMQLVMGFADRIKVLDFGLTIAEGTSEQIQNDPRVIEAYLGTETD